MKRCACRGGDATNRVHHLFKLFLDQRHGQRLPPAGGVRRVVLGWHGRWHDIDSVPPLLLERVLHGLAPVGGQLRQAESAVASECNDNGGLTGGMSLLMLMVSDSLRKPREGYDEAVEHSGDSLGGGLRQPILRRPDRGAICGGSRRWW